MRTPRELKAALRALGWEIDGPKPTPGGWKATIQRGTAAKLMTGSTEEEVLESLLHDAKEHAKRPEAQP